MRRTALLLALAPVAATAQQAPPPVRITTIAPADDPRAIPLHPEGTLPPTGVAERWNRSVGNVGTLHIDIRTVRNVVRPTVTPVLPDPARATGAAVIVAPGGAFLSLSIDSEGFDVARRLADRGVAAFVLKYRLNETPADDRDYQKLLARTFAAPTRGDAKPRPAPPRSVADALQALKLVRARAAEFRVDPARVGMIGFSAGAQNSLEAAVAPDPSARPAFVGFVYGPMRERVVPADAPPMFAAIALDDGLFGAQGFGIVEAWRRAGRPVELHAYERGEHGFGAGRAGTTSAGMLDQFVAWMESRGLLRR